MHPSLVLSLEVDHVVATQSGGDIFIDCFTKFRRHLKHLPTVSAALSLTFQRLACNSYGLLQFGSVSNAIMRTSWLIEDDWGLTIVSRLTSWSFSKESTTVRLSHHDWRRRLLLGTHSWRWSACIEAFFVTLSCSEHFIQWLLSIGGIHESLVDGRTLYFDFLITAFLSFDDLRTLRVLEVSIVCASLSCLVDFLALFACGTVVLDGGVVGITLSCLSLHATSATQSVGRTLIGNLWISGFYK